MARIKYLKDYATLEKVEWWYKIQQALPDPDKILKDNGYDYDVYRDLLNDAHLFATIEQRFTQVAQMGWELLLDKEDEIFDEIFNLLKGINLQSIANDILQALLFGYSILEINWKVENGKYLIEKIQGKPQDWFIFSKENELRLRKMTNGNYIFDEGEKLPENKFILTQFKKTFQNPYGEKLLSKVYWPVIFKKAAVDNWERLLARYGMPYLVGKYPTGTSETEQQKLLDNILQMIDDNVSVIEESTVLEFKESMKYNVGDIFKIMVEYLNKEISKAILTVTLTVDIGQTGSYKASETHRQMLEMVGLHDKKLVESGLNKIIETYVNVNYGKREPMPKVKLEKKETIVEQSVQRDRILKEMGVEFTIDYYKRRYNLSDNDFTLVKDNEKTK